MLAIHYYLLVLIHIVYWKLTDTVPDFPDEKYTFIFQMNHSGSIILSLWKMPKIILSLLYFSCWNCCLAYACVLREVHIYFPACQLKYFFKLMPQGAHIIPWYWGVLMFLFAGLWHLMEPLQFHIIRRFNFSWDHGGMYQSNIANVHTSLYWKPCRVNDGRIQAL